MITIHAPMEHVWALVIRKPLNEYPTPSKLGMLQFWECVRASFHSITHEQCEKKTQIYSIPNHIQVLASQGGWTND